MKKNFFIVLLLLTMVPAFVFAQQTLKLKSKKSITIKVNDVKFKMIRVEGGTFTMGATWVQHIEAAKNELPNHKVTLSTYFIGETEVTQELWEAVMGNNPSFYIGSNRPVESVSWDDCQEFIQRLNQLTGYNFRLPTEAEWEFAARGGTKSVGYKYSGSNNIDEVAWYWDNAGKVGVKSPDYATHAVKTKKPNELGLYDMSGNVWEWCSDWYDYYTEDEQSNPQGPTEGINRVDRGGSWYDSARYHRTTFRDACYPNDRGHIGLRLIIAL